MCLILQGTRIQIQVLKPCKSIRETSKEVLDFQSLIDSIYRGLKGIFNLMLNNFSIDNLSIEIYENQFFRSNFTHIYVYLFRLSFLTTLNIYKDYFKGCHRWYKWVKLDANVLFKQIVIEDICPSSSFSWRNCYVCTP